MSIPRRTLLIGALIATQASAASTVDQDDLRQAFIEHYATAVAEPNAVSSAIHQTLSTYPLYPYLEYQVLRSSLSSQSEARVNDFLERNADTPLYGRLLFAWARQTGAKGEWDSFDRAWQKIQRPSTDLKCLNGRHQLEQGNLSVAWEQARTLWTVGHSQPDSCDPLFNTWLESDNFSTSDALKRYQAALIKGREGLATYIKRFIRDQATLAEAERALALYQTPRLLLDEPARLKDDMPGAQALLEMSVRRLARQDLTAAIQLWVRDRDRLGLSTENQAELTRYLGVWYSKRFPNAQGRALLAQLDPQYQSADLVGWRARLALSDRNWSEARQLIERLPAEEQQSDRWRYWTAISQQGQGDSARETLQALAAERSFYGFMAAQILGVDYALNNRPASLDMTRLETLAATPAFARMRELLALERYSDARSEWNLAIADMSETDIHHAAHLVSSWGWHHQGIRGAISSEQWNDMQLRFPNPYPELYSRHAGTRDIDPIWALAVTRQESAFWMGAKSRVGARGLMQLMPATARATARRNGISLSTLDDLGKPDLNIQLGTAYLGEMFQQFNGNQAHATAAYNAGPHRVSRWLDARGELPLDIWIETIPFDETRSYVQNVLSFKVIYARMANTPVALFSDREFATLALNQQN
ncbi:transglycosylase SLT domain-containing protein [Marinobacterium marinum]|uniref:Transglycosylase SLT domain-containing protein n=1 Tax=Marinobacterium marinum TaxID=2756129 RepID=A0A7W1WX98_9GAMM|nr:transglycosylase SLT domain-containing protein [Marinobacterium marinum]MBA4501925.1 transglycosylase SLT domain-containing protein [Marinobacterium marinum]